MDAAASIKPASEEKGASVRLSVNACLTASRPGVPCTACGAACPEGAIRISGRSVRIDPAACSGCGRCTVSCPTGAISAPAFRSASLYECSRVRSSATGATNVPCLAGLSAGTLRAGLMDGDVTLIDRGWCASCPTSGGQAEPWAGALHTVNTEAEALGIAARIGVRRAPLAQWRARTAPRAKSDNPERRALFTRLARAGQAAPKTDPLAGLPVRVAAPGPRHRADQLAALACGTPLPGALFPALAVREQPQALNGLARLCPTGALSVTATDAEAALIFDATACISCGDCTQTGALALEPAGEGEFGGPVTLTKQQVATCARCRARFSPRGHQAVCDGCARDTELAALAHGLRRRA